MPVIYESWPTKIGDTLSPLRRLGYTYYSLFKHSGKQMMPRVGKRIQHRDSVPGKACVQSTQLTKKLGAGETAPKENPTLRNRMGLFEETDCLNRGLSPIPII
jgi:hypothetical protein